MKSQKISFIESKFFWSIKSNIFFVFRSVKTCPTDDIYLVRANDNLLRLEHKVNSELQLVDKWLRKNKLTLNLSKTTYLCFNKQPQVSISSKFNLFINRKKLAKAILQNI